MKATTEINRPKINTLREIISVFRSLHTELPIQYAEVLLLIANKPGITQLQLAESIGLGTSWASRTIGRFFEREHGLVRMENNPDNHRFKCIFLTEKGERFIQRLQDCLKG